MSGTATALPVVQQRLRTRAALLHHLIRRLETPRTRDRELAEALRVVAAATRSGQSLQQAFDEAGARTSGTIASACRHASAELLIGMPVERVASGMAARIGGASAQLFADVLVVQHRRGGDLGRLCNRMSQLLHERARLDAEARSATAQARFTARAVVLMPAAVAVGWAWLSPDSFRSLVSPGMLLVIAPAIVLLGVGTAVVRALALGALVHERAQPPQRNAGPVERLLVRVAGAGTLEARTMRLATAAMVAAGTLWLLGGRGLFITTTAALAVGCAVAWPVLEQRRWRRELVNAADAGMASLLELSIALLAAGATPREVVTGAIGGCPGELGALLRPACAQMELGRSPASALQSLPVVQAVAELDAWVHAITVGDRMGTPLGDVLETLLRDARTAERERFRSRAATIGPRMQIAIVMLIVPGIMWLVLAVTTTGLLRQLREIGML